MHTIHTSSRRSQGNVHNLEEQKKKKKVGVWGTCPRTTTKMGESEKLETARIYRSQGDGIGWLGPRKLWEHRSCREASSCQTSRNSRSRKMVEEAGESAANVEGSKYLAHIFGCGRRVFYFRAFACVRCSRV